MIEEDVFFFEYISLPAFSIRETVYFKPASSFTYTVRDYEMIKRVISTFPTFIKKIVPQEYEIRRSYVMRQSAPKDPSQECKHMKYRTFVEQSNGTLTAQYTFCNVCLLILLHEFGNYLIFLLSNSCKTYIFTFCTKHIV